MKKIISVRLAAIVIAGTLCLLGVNLCWQLGDRYNRLEDETETMFANIETAIEDGGRESGDAEELYEKECISKAETAARIIMDDPESIDSKDGIVGILELIEAKELHVFNYAGIMVAGTNWLRFGEGFNEIEGFSKFSPMISNRSMEKSFTASEGLNTDGEIRYAAAWQEDGEHIIVVGADEENFKNIVAYPDLKLLGSGDSSQLYALDPESFEITAASEEGMEGKGISELGCTEDDFKDEKIRIKLSIGGVPYTGIYKNNGSAILLRAISNKYIYDYIINNCVVFVVLLLIFSLAVTAVIIWFIDKNIVRNISLINKSLVSIAQGGGDTALPKCRTPEFDEMCGHINNMVETLTDNTSKMSLVFDETELPICVYELGPGMRRVVATNRIAEILHMTQDEITTILSDSDMFLKKLSEIEENPLYPGSKIYRLPGTKNNYVRMEAFLSDRYLMGVLIDETKSIIERQRIERERDIDQLTDLYSRRAFYGRVQELLEDSGTLGHALLMMADADGLKNVNDLHGHESGDRYLQAVADVLRSCRAKHCIVGRRSGDEFVLFIYGCASIEELNHHISMILRQRDRTGLVLYDGARVPVRFSVGMAYFPRDGHDFETLMHIADKRMYAEKKQRQMGFGQPETRMQRPWTPQQAFTDIKDTPPTK